MMQGYILRLGIVHLCPISNFLIKSVIGLTWECIIVSIVIIGIYDQLIFRRTWISVYNISFMKMTMLCCIEWFYIQVGMIIIAQTIDLKVLKWLSGRLVLAKETTYNGRRKEGSMQRAPQINSCVKLQRMTFKRSRAGWRKKIAFKTENFIHNHRTTDTQRKGKIH